MIVTGASPVLKQEWRALHAPLIATDNFSAVEKPGPSRLAHNEEFAGSNPAGATLSQVGRSDNSRPTHFGLDRGDRPAWLLFGGAFRFFFARDTRAISPRHLGTARGARFTRWVVRLFAPSLNRRCRRLHFFLAMNHSIRRVA